MNGARRPARVLWLSKGLGRGGTEQLIRMCAPRFDRDRFRVEVAYVLPHKDALVASLERDGVCVHALGDGGGWWGLRLARLLRGQPYDIVHTHSPIAAALAREVAPRGTAFVHTEHNVWSRYRTGTRLVNAATYRRNQVVFGVSAGVATSIRDGLRAQTPTHLEVLHHGIDTSAVRRGPEAGRAARAALGLAPDDHVIGTVANLTAKKDHATLLSAFELVRRSGLDARLVLIGSGPLEQDLRALAVRLGVDDRVLFTGSRDDVQRLLPAFDVFALTSTYEGLPIALIEAMAAGVPSVVTPVGGIPEMITDGREGRLVPIGVPRAVADELVALLGDPTLRAYMGAAAARTAEGFSIASAVERMQTAYAAILDADVPAVAS